MLQTRYEFWHEWVLKTGQLYADAHHFDTVADARKSHASALAFDWAAGKHRPSVSDLYAITMDRDESSGRARLNGRVAIAHGARHEPAPTLT
ncbi:MAG TPA: hypothetical protein VIG24_02930 [Acidimicrobiia bacterium]